ncbi:hypothetical protein JL720_498 [Aureococcus anophagefferens]|nr:hypothetical protein JL720_498 [Aureococcus anophagefferens]
MMPTSKAAQRRRRATMSMMEAMRAMMAEAKRVKAEAAAAEAAAEASSSSGAQDAGSDVSEDAAHRPWTRASTAPARRRRAAGQSARHFKDATAASTLGHAIVYLHAGGYFQARHARLFAKIERDAAAAPASWTCCDRDEALRVRCIEHHTYGAGSGLLMANHRDNDSCLTVSALLSDGHGGGRFVTYRDGRPQPHDLGAGDAVLFPRRSSTTSRPSDALAYEADGVAVWRGVVAADEVAALRGAYDAWAANASFDGAVTVNFCSPWPTLWPGAPACDSGVAPIFRAASPVAPARVFELAPASPQLAFEIARSAAAESYASADLPLLSALQTARRRPSAHAAAAAEVRCADARDCAAAALGAAPEHAAAAVVCPSGNYGSTAVTWTERRAATSREDFEEDVVVTDLAAHEPCQGVLRGAVEPQHAPCVRHGAPAAPTAAARPPPSRPATAASRRRSLEGLRRARGAGARRRERREAVAGVLGPGCRRLCHVGANVLSPASYWLAVTHDDVDVTLFVVPAPQGGDDDDFRAAYDRRAETRNGTCVDWAAVDAGPAAPLRFTVFCNHVAAKVLRRSMQRLMDMAWGRFGGEDLVVYFDATWPDRVPEAAKAHLMLFKPCATVKLFLPQILDPTIRWAVYLDTDVVFAADPAALWLGAGSAEHYYNQSAAARALPRAFPDDGANTGVLALDAAAARDAGWGPTLAAVMADLAATKANGEFAYAPAFGRLYAFFLDALDSHDDGAASARARRPTLSGLDDGRAVARLRAGPSPSSRSLVRAAPTR